MEGIKENGKEMREEAREIGNEKERVKREKKNGKEMKEKARKIAVKGRDEKKRKRKKRKRMKTN